MAKLKKKYWATGLNFDYEVQLLPDGSDPDDSEWGSIEGPFATLKEAREQVRDWIRNDRKHLEGQLFDVMTRKPS